MQCRDFREMADSYLGDELLIETNHDVIRHLESCADCRRELSARRELRRTLRSGFQQRPELQVRPEFADNLKRELRLEARRRSRVALAWRTASIGIAAGLVVVAVLATRQIKERLRPSIPPVITAGRNPTEDSNKKGGSGQALLASALNESAAGDHRDCAVGRRLPEAPTSLDDAGRKYDRAYLNLASAVAQGNLPPDVELVDAHSCVFKGQRFAHLVLKFHDQLVSVLVTELQQGSGIDPSEPMKSAVAGGYQLARFQTARHVVFVVSSLTETENLKIANALAPTVTKHIQLAEQTV